MIKNKELLPLKRQATYASKIVSEIKIKSQKDLTQAKEVRQKVFTALKIVKTKRDEIINPLKESIKKTKELFEPILTTLETSDRELKNKMEKYILKLEQEKAEKEKEVEQKIQAGEMSLEQAGKKIERVEKKQKVVKIRTIQEVVIVNKQKIPKEYWMIDEVAVRKDALAGKKIAGVEVREKKIVIN